MSSVEVIGWVATASGTILGLPQMLRLVRTGRVAGLSVTGWQAMLVVNLSWTAHGISIGQFPQILTSALSMCATVLILCLMARELGDLGPRHRNPDRRHRHRNHHGVQPELVVAPRPGSAPLSDGQAMDTHQTTRVLLRP